MRDICKSFSGVPVLKDVNFTLRRGEVHALVGGNGAGKSTLMKIFTGVYTKDSGTVCVDGQEVHFKSYDDASQAGVRMIFQELSLVPTLTIYENIFLNNESLKGLALDRKEMRQMAGELLKSLGLDISPRELVSSLPVGYQQMVEIAKALSMNAKILVLDEPTASLTDAEVGMLFATMERLKAKGVSMVYISHRMSEILQVTDTVSVLRNGQVVLTAPTDQLDIPAIVHAMLGGSAEKSFEWVPRIHPPSDQLMLNVQNLQLNSIVKDVTFQVRKGEILGIAGLMGSGRTEILKALFGMEKVKSGQISLDGQPVNFRNVQQAVRAGMALVPEDRRREGLVLGHTVKANTIVTVLDQLLGGWMISEKKSNQLVNDKVAELNVKTDGINKTISLLSGGNQQKVVIAKWLAANPKVLLLDEPTAGIDIEAKGEITAIIRDFADRGNSVVLVSSELVELMAVCDRVIVLHDGVVTQNLDRHNIESEEVLQNAIQG
ncbi:MAG: sugar ABC transporter ATP-binding protein [Cellulomonadaceae bacterium]|jgi:ribose transport system ATP-binding protein|nr:sugar ABC transporter ATP-binding protein [Cellulomonadaceae bacterium]